MSGSLGQPSLSPSCSRREDSWKASEKLLFLNTSPTLESCSYGPDPQTFSEGVCVSEALIAFTVPLLQGGVGGWLGTALAAVPSITPVPCFVFVLASRSPSSNVRLL